MTRVGFETTTQALEWASSSCFETRDHCDRHSVHHGKVKILNLKQHRKFPTADISEQVNCIGFQQKARMYEVGIHKMKIDL
jgi:hypothetical protein